MLTQEDREAIREIVATTVASVLSVAMQLTMKELERIRGERAGKTTEGERTMERQEKDVTP